MELLVAVATYNLNKHILMPALIANCISFLKQVKYQERSDNKLSRAQKWNIYIDYKVFQDQTSFMFTSTTFLYLALWRCTDRSYTQRLVSEQ